ncbi:MAG: hypothetical protein DMG51_06310 [Acidobacteria bacterium]|nr:MAG: hypothetical protein DMG51_06310 [Acidobacteriota bacterium]
MLAEVEKILLREVAFVQLQEDQASEHGNFSDGLARHIPLLGARGSERRKRGTKHQQRLLKKTIGSRHDRDLDSVPHCIQYPGEVSSPIRYERETLIDQKPFADRLTVELTNKISRIPRRPPAPSFYFKGKPWPLSHGTPK